MNKDIRAAIDERRVMYWEYAPLSANQPMSRYQLRAEIETTERGHRVTRRLFASLSEVSAERVQAEILADGVPVYARISEVPANIAAVVGGPQQAREAVRWRF